MDGEGREVLQPRRPVSKTAASRCSETCQQKFFLSNSLLLVDKDGVVPHCQHSPASGTARSILESSRELFKVIGISSGVLHCCDCNREASRNIPQGRSKRNKNPMDLWDMVLAHRLELTCSLL